MHSLRIGRENNLRHADVRADLLNDITSHTSDQGRRSYSRVETEELIQASRAADSAVSTPLEKSVHFGSDRSSARVAVGIIKRDGRVIDGVSLQQGADYSMTGGSSQVRAAQSAAVSKKKARTGGMQNGSIESFFVKK